MKSRTSSRKRATEAKLGSIPNTLGPSPNISALTCDVTAAKVIGYNPRTRVSDQNSYTVDRVIFREVLLTGLKNHVTYEKSTFTTDPRIST